MKTNIYVRDFEDAEDYKKNDKDVTEIWASMMESADCREMFLHVLGGLGVFSECRNGEEEAARNAGCRMLKAVENNTQWRLDINFIR